VSTGKFVLILADTPGYSDDIDVFAAIVTNKILPLLWSGVCFAVSAD
jgi:hypothetical protein